MTHSCDCEDSASQWSSRERELLAVALQLLQTRGYDGLTVDVVAATAHASKATVYRRWPSKAQLVAAAIAQGIREVDVEPDTGSLRSDLLQIGSSIIDEAPNHAATLRAVLGEMSQIPALLRMLDNKLFGLCKVAMIRVLERAAARGEISAEVIDDDLWDLMQGYLAFRSVLPGRPAEADTVRRLVDNVMMPSLTRSRRQ